ncbi:MAG: hypothetical protein WBA55_02215 [Allopontixanthobacter sediminis]
MGIEFGNLVAKMQARAVIGADEITALRKAGWSDGMVSRAEAETLFSINDSLAAPDAQWCDFFTEAVGEYVVNGTEPKGYVAQEEANWLVQQITRDGRLCAMSELELLVRIYERARNVPDSLKAFVLAQLEQAVLTGKGPTRSGGELSDTHVSSAEAQILRRMLFAPASDRPAAVSRREAEMLYRLKDATLGAPNAPEWKTLFAQGVGNYLMGYVAESAQLDRVRALELEAFVADNRASIGGFMGRMATTSPRAFAEMFGKQSPAAGVADRVAAAQEVSGDERLWLEGQIARNDQIDEYDQALLEFIDKVTAEG